MLKDAAPLAAPAALGDRANMVFSGTAVTRGRGRAVVTATGMATEMGRIARLLGRTEEQPTPLQREIDRIGRMLGIAVIAIAVVVVARHPADLRHRRGVRRSSTCCSSASRSPSPRCPRACPAVLTVVLALGVQRMARRARDRQASSSSVETLGSASVICSDKTGTLTQERDDGPDDRHRVGRGRRHRQRLSTRGASCSPDGGPLDGPGAARRSARRARRREPGERRGAARGGRRVDDPGRPDRGRVPRRRAQDRGLAAGARPRASSASARSRSPRSAS